MTRPLVAIVDDEPAVLRALKRLVEANGFSARTYSSGEELLDSCLDGVKCVVLDINLAGISGIETKRRFPPAERQLPVIFISALDSPKVQQEVLGAGCSGFLRKPFTGKHLIGALHKALDRGLA